MQTVYKKQLAIQETFFLPVQHGNRFPMILKLPPSPQN